MDAKEYLQQYSESQRRVKLLRKEYDSITELIKSVCPSPYYDKLFKDDIRLIKAKVNARKMKELEAEQQKICDEVLSVIKRIPGVKGQILRERYIDLMLWEDIADRECYSIKNVYYLHSHALEEVQNILDSDKTIK